MFILSDQIIILFPADTFSRKQLIFRPHYKRNKYKLLGKNDHAWPSFALIMPKVGSRYSKFGLEKNKPCWVRIPGFNLSDKKKVYSIYECWTTGVGWHSDFSMVSHFENLYDSIWTEELFTNVHEPTEIMPYFFFTLLIVSPSSLLWQSVWFLPI